MDTENVVIDYRWRVRVRVRVGGGGKEDVSGGGGRGEHAAGVERKLSLLEMDWGK